METFDGAFEAVMGLRRNETREMCEMRQMAFAGDIENNPDVAVVAQCAIALIWEALSQTEGASQDAHTLCMNIFANGLMWGVAIGVQMEKADIP